MTLIPTIIYEDTNILVVDKPAGLVVHSDGRTKEATLADWLLSEYPELVNVGEAWVTPSGENIPRPGIVHRLDRETSGVLVVAKTQETFENLKEQFKEHTIQKTYRAFVYDTLKETEGEIDRPITKSSSDFRKWSAQPGGRGVPREAHTQWRVLETRTDNGHTYTYMELSPTTGRTHQLRVHLKALHHPIVCDALYAPNRECALGFARTALHAHTITLAMPHEEGARRTFEAPLPEDFKKALG